MVVISCEYCGKEFKRFPVRLRDGKKHYCSNQCKNLSQKIPSSYIEKVCETCGKRYAVKRLFDKRSKSRYCSRACMDKGFSINRKGSGNPLWVDRVKANCIECGKEFYILQSAIEFGRKFCSKECSYAYKSKNYRGPIHWLWKHGKRSNQPKRGYGKDWNKIADAVRERDNNTCKKCGKKSLFRKMDVHHKIPFRTFNGNIKLANRMSNLVSLCHSCHKFEDAKIRRNKT